MQDTYDVVIIGGGVVGCACAFELSSHGYSCLLVEKNEHLVDEASSGNSGMLHTGFDALENSKELHCIQRCQERIFPLLERLGVPFNKIGATMVAWNHDQLMRFPEVIRKSNKAGCSRIRELSQSELRQREPCVNHMAHGALFVEDEAVTDPWLLPVLLANDACKKGAVVLQRAQVVSVKRGTVWHVETTRGVFRSKCVVNCGGLYGDIVDRLAGREQFCIKPRKGQYTMYSKSARDLINSSIVPVPTDVGKGVIVFKSVYENVVVGPTAEDVDSREKAEIDSKITKRLASVAMTTLPNLTSHPVVNMYTGVRPATDFKDYIIQADEKLKWVTVGGIRSTGLSGCLGIANDVHHLIKDDLKLETTIGISNNVDRPEVQFTNFGTAVIDGHEYTITHPITVHGKNIEFASRI